MRDYEEKSYYEIQLDNKQLILVFLAGVTVCVLVFILGMMVGKGRKEAEFAAASRTEKEVVRPEPDLTPPQEIQEVKPVTKKQKDENKKKEASAEPSQEDPEYYGLDKIDEKPLVKDPAKQPKEEKKVADKEPEKKVAAETQKAKTEPKIETEPKAESETEPQPTLKEGGRYTVQVMATSSKTKAEQQLSTLQSKGYTAFMKEEKAGEASVFKVRVGEFSDKDSARKIATKLKQELQLESWVANLD